MNLSNIKTLTIFGEGITAKTIKAKLVEFPEFQIVEPDQTPELGIISPGLVAEKYLSKYSFPIISEIELAYQLFKYVGKTPYFIVVSGTNGKTTTTSTIADLLNIPSSGNIGTPLISMVNKNLDKIPDKLVVEVSSYQLETTPSFRSNIYILLNITPDHLNRHKTMEAYGKIKVAPIKNQTKTDYFIYNGDDSNILHQLSKYNNIQPQTIDFSKSYSKFQKYLKVSPLFGNHNKENLTATLEAVCIVENQDWTTKIKKIKAIPHRCEPVKAIKGITFINDSKSTNIDSVFAALKAFPPLKTILLLGGQKKDTPYKTLVEFIKEKQIRVVTFGADRDYFNRLLIGATLLLDSQQILELAIDTAYQKAHKNDIILLSPGCASFDQYQNFEERGNAFSKFVSELPSKK